MATKKKKKASKAKKAVKKTAKKPAKKVAKKKVIKKKAAKKAAKKTIKKAAKKPAKKAAPKKKTMKKSAAPKAAKTPKAAPMAEAAAPQGPHPLLGQSLPFMTLPNQNGEQVDLTALTQENPKVVLYFYPKDDTPGCTKEACDFRDNFNRIQSAGVKVIGVSPDSPESHQKFIAKYNLNFDLLSDENHALADAMHVWKEKSFMGRNYMGVDRSTFVLKDGEIAHAWQPVKVEGHVDEVLAALA
ncbi:MAG: thioredoxin-dependent thiol peroxidase [Bdellovibrionales bacterium]|nr:thioredoxin-dependent thiol peroxidase [Bdellovibrionales bacterium]